MSRDGKVSMRPHKSNPKRNALLSERAHGLRHRPTASEAALHRLLSGKKLGVSFKRQVPIAGRYIADFLASGPRLIIEVDGGSHHGREQADARRDRVLRRLGYTVLRLEAELVLRQPELAVARVRAALGGV